MKKLLLFLLIISSKSFAQKKYEIAQIKTPLGEILVWLYNETPKHKASFIQLAKTGYWDSLTFNRVIPNFVIQGGCPDTEQGFKDTTYLLAPEFVPTLKHEYGTFAAGRDVIKGMDIVDAIANAPKDKTDTPLKAITLDVNIMKVKAKKLNQYGFKIPRSN